jgi:hypothetical protein
MPTYLAHILKTDAEALRQLPPRTFFALIRLQNPAAQIVGQRFTHRFFIAQNSPNLD